MVANPDESEDTGDQSYSRRPRQLQTRSPENNSDSSSKSDPSESDDQAEDRDATTKGRDDVPSRQLKKRASERSDQRDMYKTDDGSMEIDSSSSSSSEDDASYPRLEDLPAFSSLNPPRSPSQRSRDSSVDDDTSDIDSSEEEDEADPSSRRLEDLPLFSSLNPPLMSADSSTSDDSEGSDSDNSNVSEHIEEGRRASLSNDLEGLPVFSSLYPPPASPDSLADNDFGREYDDPSSSAGTSDDDDDANSALSNDERPIATNGQEELFVAESLHHATPALTEHGSHVPARSLTHRESPVRTQLQQISSPSTPAAAKGKSKRKAQEANSQTRKRTKTGRVKSSEFVLSDHDSDPTEGASQGPRGSRIYGKTDHGRHHRDRSGSVDLSTLPNTHTALPPSSGRKQQAKPIFTQTPLNFKAHNETKPHQGSAAQSSQPGKSRPDSKSQPVKQPNLAPQPHGSTLPNRITPEEARRMSNVIEEFRDKHSLTTTEVINLIQQSRGVGKPSAKVTSKTDELWNNIMATCPSRPRRKIIEYCRKNFHLFKARAGNWTQEEEEQLAKLVKEGGNKWAEYSTILQRHPQDLRDHYRNYVVFGVNREVSSWSTQETDALLRLVAKAKKSILASQEAHPDDPHYRRPWNELIDWQRISEQHGSRNRLQCFNKWRKMRS